VKTVNHAASVPQESTMTKRYRLLTRAQLDGAVREPGYVFTLAEGELGPHRTVRASNAGAAVTGVPDDGQMRDDPLYAELKED
jgi:hypothetical protein